jgi:hypothetical protein
MKNVQNDLFKHGYTPRTYMNEKKQYTYLFLNLKSNLHGYKSLKREMLKPLYKSDFTILVCIKYPMIVYGVRRVRSMCDDFILLYQATCVFLLPLVIFQFLVK